MYALVGNTNVLIFESLKYDETQPVPVACAVNLDNVSGLFFDMVTTDWLGDEDVYMTGVHVSATMVV